MDISSESLTKLSRPNASADAAALIREAIIDGRLEPGTRLREGWLAESFGISRTPIREALMMLQVEGLVKTEARRGAVVRSYAASELEDLFQLRALLDSYSAHRAAERRTEADLRSMSASISRLEEMNLDTNSAVDIWRENIAFHVAVATAAHTARLVEFVQNVMQLPGYYSGAIDYADNQRIAFLNGHKRIFEAIRQHDSSRAEVLARAHILDAHDWTIEVTGDLEHLGSDGKPADALPGRGA
jgi:DNA-binding GntR family transcriptional regulator